LNLIPKCSLAAVLVVTGFKLVDLDQIWELRIFGRAQVVIYFVTALTIVFSDLLVGVILGLVLSMLHLLHQFASLRIEKTLMEGNEFRIILDGAATFLSLPKLAATLENLPLQTTSLHVDLQNVSFIDHACIELLNNWRSQNESAGRKVTFEWGESRPKYNLGSEHDL
jgi:MFS superfamily sulfate permease-like transporter